jgi:hypothetical protein
MGWCTRTSHWLIVRDDYGLVSTTWRTLVFFTTCISILGLSIFDPYHIHMFVGKKGAMAMNATHGDITQNLSWWWFLHVHRSPSAQSNSSQWIHTLLKKVTQPRIEGSQRFMFRGSLTEGTEGTEGGFETRWARTRGRLRLRKMPNWWRRWNMESLWKSHVTNLVIQRRYNGIYTIGVSLP